MKLFPEGATIQVAKTAGECKITDNKTGEVAENIVAFCVEANANDSSTPPRLILVMSHVPITAVAAEAETEIQFDKDDLNKAADAMGFNLVPKGSVQVELSTSLLETSGVIKDALSDHETLSRAAALQGYRLVRAADLDKAVDNEVGLRPLHVSGGEVLTSSPTSPAFSTTAGAGVRGRDADFSEPDVDPDMAESKD